MLKRLFFILSLFSYSYCFATVLVQESTIVTAEQYHELAKQYANKASYYNTMAGLYESQTLSLTSPICTNFYESSLQLKPYNPWLGTQFGFGAGGANGDTTNSSINGSAIVNYKPESGAAGWQYNTIGQYDYLNTYGSSANKNRLYMQQNGAYMYDKYNGVFAQASYLNDANDGYYYVWNENIGYKLQIINNDLMGLQFSLGPGLQQVQVVSSNIAGTQAQWLTQLTYNLNLNNILTFYEQLQNTATQLNTTTYSISTLNLQIDKNFGIGVNYQITYNSNPPIGKSSTNAISSINLIYGIN